MKWLLKWNLLTKNVFSFYFFYWVSQFQHALFYPILNSSAFEPMKTERSSIYLLNINFWRGFVARNTLVFFLWFFFSNCLQNQGKMYSAVKNCLKNNQKDRSTHWIEENCHISFGNFIFGRNFCCNNILYGRREKIYKKFDL